MTRVVTALQPLLIVWRDAPIVAPLPGILPSGGPLRSTIHATAIGEGKLLGNYFLTTGSGTPVVFNETGGTFRVTPEPAFPASN